MHLVPHSPDSSNYAASGGCHSPSVKPVLTGRSPSDTEQDLFALPPWWGGLGLLFVLVMSFHLLAT